MGHAELPTVLVVEDEGPLVELYARWLADDYEVRTASNGRDALDQMDSAVDVVLLDRLMPGMSGDEVLDGIRRAGADCRIAMVTAIDPDFDILTMGFDDYVTKPVDRARLLETVDRLVARSSFAELEREFYALAAKRATLQAAKSPEELRESEEFADLTERVEILKADLDTTMPSIRDGEFVSMVRKLEDDRTGGAGAKQ